MTEKSLSTGDLAYVETFYGGVVKCRITRITILVSTPGDFPRQPEITVKITGQGGGTEYNKGDMVILSPRSVLPRSSVRYVNGKLRVRLDWHLIIDGVRHEVYG